MSGYWHAFTGTSEDGTFGLAVFGSTPLSADDRIESGELVRDYTIPMDLGIVATYAATFDHEPTCAEKDALNPNPDPELVEG